MASYFYMIKAAGSFAIRKYDLGSVWNFFLSGSRPISRSFYIVTPSPISRPLQILLSPLFPCYFILFLSRPYFHATSRCSSLSPISMLLHIVPLFPLFPSHFTLFLCLPHFQATSYSLLSSTSSPLHIISLSHLRPPANMCLGEGTLRLSLSLQYFINCSFWSCIYIFLLLFPRTPPRCTLQATFLVVLAFIENMKN